MSVIAKATAKHTASVSCLSIKKSNVSLQDLVLDIRCKN